MKNINKIVYYLLIASANIFLTTAQQFTIDLNKKFYPKGELVIESMHQTPEDIYIKEVTADGKKLKGYTISQEELVNAGTLKFTLEDTHK